MNTTARLLLAAMASASLLATSCSKDDSDLLITRDLPASIDTVDVPDAISYQLLTAPGNTTLDGDAYVLNSNNGALYLLASRGVEVECPGDLSSTYRGNGDFFRFQFFVAGSDTTVFDANFNTVIGGVAQTVGSLIAPPGCPFEREFDINYTIANDRISGTITGEYQYVIDVKADPFFACENFASTGVVDVTFDLPLRNCN